jgi:hypothetical protein
MKGEGVLEGVGLKTGGIYKVQYTPFVQGRLPKHTNTTVTESPERHFRVGASRGRKSVKHEQLHSLVNNEAGSIKGSSQGGFSNISGIVGQSESKQGAGDHMSLNLSELQSKTSQQRLLWTWKEPPRTASKDARLSPSLMNKQHLILRESRAPEEHKLTELRRSSNRGHGHHKKHRHHHHHKHSQFLKEGKFEILDARRDQYEEMMSRNQREAHHESVMNENILIMQEEKKLP